MGSVRMASVLAASHIFLLLILMLGDGLHGQYEYYDQDTSLEAMAPASLPKAGPKFAILPKASPRRPPYLRFMVLPADDNGDKAVQARPAVRYVLGGMRGKRGGGGCLGRCLRMKMLHPAQCNSLC